MQGGLLPYLCIPPPDTCLEGLARALGQWLGYLRSLKHRQGWAGSRGRLLLGTQISKDEWCTKGGMRCRVHNKGSSSKGCFLSSSSNKSGYLSPTRSTRTSRGCSSSYSRRSSPKPRSSRSRRQTTALLLAPTSTCDKPAHRTSRQPAAPAHSHP